MSLFAVSQVYKFLFSFPFFFNLNFFFDELKKNEKIDVLSLNASVHQLMTGDASCILFKKLIEC